MPVRLGAVGYLNARPLVFRLEREPRFALRFDVPSECTRLLHSGESDLGLIPSIEYLRGDGYQIVPGLAIVSRGPVASVALYTTKPMSDVRSVVMDASSRTSVALVRVLCQRLFKIRPDVKTQGPDLGAMLAEADAALVIGDNALLLDHTTLRIRSSARPGGHADGAEERTVQKVDLGEAWTSMTGLPFVWAFWAGRPGAVVSADIERLEAARDAAVTQPNVVAQEFFHNAPQYWAIGERYLRENLNYYLNSDERAGLELFYRYAAEADLVPSAQALRFY